MEDFIENAFEHGISKVVYFMMPKNKINFGKIVTRQIYITNSARGNKIDISYTVKFQVGNSLETLTLSSDEVFDDADKLKEILIDKIKNIEIC